MQLSITTLPNLLLTTLALFTLPLSTTAETVLGLYIFSRHGDRTSKSTPPTNLTNLGYSQVFTSGSYFRSRYVSPTAYSPILGLSPDLVNWKQITASAPLDTVLIPSAQGWLQGLYPPVEGDTGEEGELGAQRLRNGTDVRAPLGGYQLIPIQTVTTGTASEDSAWLQGAGNCANAIGSSNAYFASPEYGDLLEGTRGFYEGLAPVVNGTFAQEDLSYKNAYAIYDLINVALIHNSTTALSTITPPTFSRLSSLAATHELNLAYNTSDPIRAIAGSTLAAQIIQALNHTLSSPTHAPKINVQFGAYGAFQSFFGLANLTSLPGADADAESEGDDGVRFAGIPDYASTMVFELVTNASVPSSSSGDFPSPEDVSVRFLFHNGTASPAQAGNDDSGSVPKPYPLFGQTSLTLPWTDFVAGMNNFAIGDQEHWCRACGNSTGVCASVASSSSGSSGAGGDAGGSGATGRGMSTAVAGVVGAMVTLAVILGVEALVMLVAGLRLVSRKRRAGTGAGAGAEEMSSGEGNGGVGKGE